MAHEQEEEDPHLGAGPDGDEQQLFREGESESWSLLSDDSVLPVYERERKPGSANTLLEACGQNDRQTLRRLLDRGVTQEEVRELDINGRNGLMLAASMGFVDIVVGLHHCPFIDINHQDNDGNTALMIAAQAGYITIMNYILNFYAGVDTEVRDSRGFTALMKAAMQGRNDCVSSLVMAGADLNSVDTARGKSAKEWALKTGRYDTLYRLRRLQLRPCAEQFCHGYVAEWPELRQLVAKATAPKTRGQRLSERLRSTLTISLPHDPRDNGVLDHMVRMTTSVRSPLVATGCRPLCPTSPPEAGKRRLAVPELAQRNPGADLEQRSVRHSDGSVSSASPSVDSGSGSGSSMSLASCCTGAARRGSVLSNRVRGLLPRGIGQRNSVFPAGCIPQIRITRSAERTPKKEKKRKMSKAHLEPPLWKYKEAKQERKRERVKAEEAAEREKSEKKKKKKKKKNKKKK